MTLTRKLSLIKDRGQTNHILIVTLICDLQFQSPVSDGMTHHRHAKDQGNRSVSSKDRVETDGHMEALYYFPC